MTAPVEHGYPDFGRYRASADKVYFDATVADIDGATDYGPFFVGDVDYLSLFFSPTTNHFLVTLGFYDAPSGGANTGLFAFSARNTCTVDQVVPVRGPYVIMTVQPNAVNGAFSALLASCPLHHSGGQAAGAGSLLISRTVAAIGAGATVTTLAQATRQAPAVWSVSSPAATWVARLESITFQGVVTVLDRITQLSNEDARPIYLPHTTVQISVDNTTGVASTFSAYLNTATMLTGS